MSNQVVNPGVTNLSLPPEWQDKMAQYAKTGLVAERIGGNMFSSKGGILTFGGVAVPNNKMQVVIIASMHERVWYSKPYQQDTPQSPECYAFSVTGDNMVPHAEAENPISPQCAGCKFDEWGSDPVRGKGKACKERRRIALMPAGALISADDVAKATVGYLSVSVTSTRAFSEHVKHLAMRALPVFAAVSEVDLHPDPKNMWAYGFKLIAPINNPELLTALETRHLGELSAMQFPYPKPAAPVAAPAATSTTTTANPRKF
jgi:hypothetical protein